MSQMVGTFMGETSLSSFEASLDRLFNGDGNRDVGKSVVACSPCCWMRACCDMTKCIYYFGIGHYEKINPNHHIASQLRARFQKNVVVYVASNWCYVTARVLIFCNVSS